MRGVWGVDHECFVAEAMSSLRSDRLAATPERGGMTAADQLRELLVDQRSHDVRVHRDVYFMAYTTCDPP